MWWNSTTVSPLPKSWPWKAWVFTISARPMVRGQGGNSPQRQGAGQSLGGLKAKGHPIGATGAAQVAEIVEQLRGESGPRQVDGAKVGLVDTLGGDFGTTCNLILRS